VATVVRAMQVHILALAEGRLIFLCLDNKSPLEEWIFVLRHRRLREKFPSILLNGHRLHRRKARLITAQYRFSAHLSPVRLPFQYVLRRRFVQTLRAFRLPSTAVLATSWMFHPVNNLFDPKNRSCHTAHASIHLAAQGTQHERCGLQFGVRPFVLSSPLFGRIEGLLSLNCGFKDE
jgi:hypothetical protein